MKPDAMAPAGMPAKEFFTQLAQAMVEAKSLGCVIAVPGTLDGNEVYLHFKIEVLGVSSGDVAFPDMDVEGGMH